MASTQTAGRLMWAHTDSEDLSARARQAYALGDKAWPDGAEGSRLFRAWLCAQLSTIASLGPTPLALVQEKQPGASVSLLGSQYLLEPTPSARPENLDWQNTLAVCLAAICTVGPVGKKEKRALGAGILRLTTINGDPAETPTAAPTTSFLPVIGWVVVSIVGLAGAAVAYLVASQVNETRALEITQQGKTTLAIAAMNEASTMLELHQQQEKERGKDIPYDAQQLAQLQVLRKTITDVAGWQPPDMKSIPNAKKFSENLGAGLGFGTMIAMAIGAWLLLGDERRRQKVSRGLRLAA